MNSFLHEFMNDDDDDDNDNDDDDDDNDDDNDDDDDDRCLDDNQVGAKEAVKKNWLPSLLIFKLSS